MELTKETLTIGEVARRANLRPSTLRYYESLKLLAPTSRVSGQRRYSPAVLPRLSVIRFAQQAGFSLAEIQKLLAEVEGSTSEHENWQSFAYQKLLETEQLITQARARKELLEKSLACGCAALESCELVACVR